MRMMKQNILLPGFVIFLIVTCHLEVAENAWISHIWPRTGSLGGETRLTIYGSGFSTNQFNFGPGNEHLGNRVSLVSDTRSFDCPVHKDGSHATQIQCYTPDHIPADTYCLEVYVDGVLIPRSTNICGGNTNNAACKFTPSDGYTPRIDKVTPTFSPPGTLITMCGKIFTDRYGGDIEKSSNGQTATILRVFFGPYNCELKNMTSDTFFGITLYNGGTSIYGCMTCKPHGNLVYNMNTSFILDSHYGRSLTSRSSLKPTPTGRLYTVQTYAEIISISPQTGSMMGGTRVMVEGRNFDEFKANATVVVGDKACLVQSVNETRILCVTSPLLHTQPLYPGNRGILHEVWNSTFMSYASLADVLTLDQTKSDYSSQIYDYATYFSPHIDYFVSRFQGFFVPAIDGTYQFRIKADDAARLYFSLDEFPENMVLRGDPNADVNTPEKEKEGLLAVCTLHIGAYWHRPYIGYYMVAVHQEIRGGTGMTIGVGLFQTSLTNTMTTAALQAIQRITVSSIVYPEVQRISLFGFNQTTPVSEVQTVEVRIMPLLPLSHGRFRLGLFEVYTELLPGDIDAESLQASLLALPVVPADSLAVSMETFANGSRYNVTFLNGYGDLPSLNFQIEPGLGGAMLNITIIESIAGEPDFLNYRLMMNGIPSAPILHNASALQIQSILADMFQAICPAVITSPRPDLTASYEDFESIEGNSYGGSIIRNKEAFCGRASLKNSNNIYHHDNGVKQISISMYPKICFAYLGNLDGYIRFYFFYNDDDQLAPVTHSHDFRTLTEWSYVCFDMLSLAQRAIPTGSMFRLRSIHVYMGPNGNDFFIDSVFIGRKETTSDFSGLNLRRQRPAFASGTVIDSVVVTENLDASYNVTMRPLTCGHAFAHFQLVSGQIVTGSNTTNNSVTYSLSSSKINSTGASIQVTQEQAATPPVTGSFDVTFEGKTVTVPIESTGNEMKNILSEISELGQSVSRAGDQCLNYYWEVASKLRGGFMELLQIDKSNVTSLNGDIVASHIQHGSLWYEPIPSDMLRTVHHKPQVMAYINTIPTACAANCTFEYRDDATPTVLSVSPDTGATATIISIAGTLFSVTASENDVSICGGLCYVTESTATLITCTAGYGVSDTCTVVVNVRGRGLASHPSGDVMFSYSLTVTGLSLSSGSTAGGALLNITGHGFSSTASVLLGDQTCSLLHSTSQIIQCTVPEALVTGDSAVDVIVTVGSESRTAPIQFSYQDALTATIVDVTPTSASVHGNTVISITGSGFGASPYNDMALTVGNVVATILTYKDTEIIAELPPLQPGSYAVQLLVNENGYADLRKNSVSNITSQLSVHNVYPLKGSIYGGTDITIMGNGFTTDMSLINVMVGGHDCIVSSAVANQIRCQIADTGITHRVSNEGVHPDFGAMYAWMPKKVYAHVGDVIRWFWHPPGPVKNKLYRVQQVDNMTSSDYNDDNGFSSGKIGTESGAFEHQFTHPGKYYYSSGLVDAQRNIIMYGVIEVNERLPSVETIMVKVNGFEAIYNTNSGVADPTDSNQCVSEVAPIATCSQPQPTSDDSNHFSFAFWECLSPVVTLLSTSRTRAIDDITLQAIGFASKSCQNEIRFGDYHCLVQSVSGESLTCRIDISSEPVVGQWLHLSARVNNYGNALIKISNDADKMLVIVPFISSISPVSGSTAGGTRVTVTGSGFSMLITGSVSLTIGGYSCTLLNVTYTEIICKTQPSQEKTVTVEVAIGIDSGDMIAECSISSGCLFTYSTSQTPMINGITPNITSAPNDIFSINGSGFGESAADLIVTFASSSCVVSTVTDSLVTCAIVGAVPVGVHTILLYVKDKGDAAGLVTLQSEAVISSIDPSSGSRHGGTLVTITGNGFVPATLTVMVGLYEATIISATDSQLVIRTPQGNEQTQLVITSAGYVYPIKQFNFSVTATPTITYFTPLSGKSGDTLTITGTSFGVSESDNTVCIDGKICTITSSKVTELMCIVSTTKAGNFPIVLTISGKGYANMDKMFHYNLIVDTMSQVEGSFGGGQLLAITGNGLSPSSTKVMICERLCTIAPEYIPTFSVVHCITPVNPDYASQTKACNVSVSVGEEIATLNYTYSAAKTAVIQVISPTRGGTQGGTTLTITGTGFRDILNENNVTIDGVACEVTSAAFEQMVCVTGVSGRTIQSNVTVHISDYGAAVQVNADFHYIDVWHSPFTWGGNGPPTAGDLVVIPSGQTLLLDVDTPVLKMILIQGELIFDEQDIELQAENILITSGGKLQVGTESSPFQHKAIITLHGGLATKELPIYGSKALAVRHGVLDLHGIPKPITWTRLAATAEVNDTLIMLQDSVNWSVGDKIVIATTGDQHSQRESEIRQIVAISGNGLVLTLDWPLNHKHYGITETLAGRDVHFRAEVGLLSHNIIIRGSSDLQWNDNMKSCDEGFNPGEFAVHTCFQGRYGDEIGSDEFGGHILLHAPRRDENLAIGRLEYVEVTHAGQAFRLGRYPIHFHLNGDMSESYVRGCSIHHTFNRAVNIHGSSNILVKDNVVYNVMGGAFFLEDGIEQGNIFDHNLGVFVRSSSSLLNDDIVPAFIWVTNPKNTIINNVAAGGTHFGYWYRLEDHPRGPSHTRSICPLKNEFGLFENNTAHSCGSFGFWIFPVYTPVKGGHCSSNTPIPAIFRNYFAYHNDKGAEFVKGGVLHFENFTLVHNRAAGFEGKYVSSVDPLTGEGPMIRNSLIVAHTDEFNDFCTNAGIILPFFSGFQVRNVTFLNFNVGSCTAFAWATVTGVCSTACAGFTTNVSDIHLINSPNGAFFHWKHIGVIIDEDGSITGGTPDRYILTTTGLLPSNKCPNLPLFTTGVTISVCDADTNILRFSFNSIGPRSLDYKTLIISNSFGSDVVPYVQMQITQANGWTTFLPAKEEYTLAFENAQKISNISYSATLYQLQVNDYVIFSHRLEFEPDRFLFDNQIVQELDTPLSADSYHGDWIFDRNTNDLKYIVSRKRRASTSSAALYEDIYFRIWAYRCFFPDCKPPPDPEKIPPPDDRPDDAVFWSESAALLNMPVDGDDVVIPKGVWMVADVNLPIMEKLVVYGTLELENHKNYTLNATYIVIQGGRLIIGWEDNLFKGDVEIILRGSHSTPDLDISSTPMVGSKAIGVFGGLDMHGKIVGVTWTHLNKTADIGDTILVLNEPVTWLPGIEIVVTTTGYSAWETETFTVTTVSEDGFELMLNSSLHHRHIAFSEMINGQQYTIASEVGLLSRNIRIIGEDYNNLFSESFGARVVIGRSMDPGGTVAYLGYARISNVEFYHTGQEGYTSSYDPRYSITYVDTGAVSMQRPSYVRSCVFHNGFSPAIGVYSTHNLVISDNVIHHTVGSGIIVQAANVVLRHNLVCLMVFPGTYQDCEEAMTDYMAAIDGRAAVNLNLEGNSVAGSERMAYRVPGESCGTSAWSGNVAHSSLIGIGVLPSDPAVSNCIQFSNFHIYKCIDFGLYLQTCASIRLQNLFLAENVLSVFTFVIGSQDKTVLIEKSTIVGTTESFDCKTDVINFSDPSLGISASARSNYMGNVNSKVGISWPTFSLSDNKLDTMTFTGIVAAPTTGGRMDIKDVIFAHFKTSCGVKDFAIATNPFNDDGQHPVISEQITFLDVSTDNKVFIHRPNIGKINDEDCVDMDCDGLKKALLKDIDGTFLGVPGAIIPQSEYEWNDNPRRDLGTQRIPKLMLTDVNNKRLDPDIVAPYHGIIRNDACQWHQSWQAYECHEMNYEMLIIESMDADSSSRRLSPVAILSDTGYLDLINGPQDHGWCDGYTCRSRLSKFMALVATNHHYEIYFTSTAPQQLRLQLLNTNNMQAITVAIYFDRTSRLDVFTKGNFIPHKNGYYGDDGKYKFKAPTFPDEFKPTLSDLLGSNYLDQSLNLMYVLIRGSTPVTIKLTPQIIVAFNMPAMTVDEFYGKNIVNNLALFLGIDPSKIRIMSVVSEMTGGNNKRRKRDTADSITVIFEIGNEPSVNEDVPDAGYISSEDLCVVAGNLTNAVQMNTLDVTLNITILSSSISEPPPSSDNPEYATFISSTTTSLRGVTLVPILQVKDLNLDFTARTFYIYERHPFSIQPKVKAVDSDGLQISQVGTIVHPWLISVALSPISTNYSAAELNGNRTMSFRNGWAQFLDLSVSHPGIYMLSFNLTYPSEGIFPMMFADVMIQRRPLGLKIISVSIDVVISSPVTVVAGFLNLLTGSVMDNIAWRVLAIPRPSLAKLHPHVAHFGIDRSLNPLNFNFQKTIQGHNWSASAALIDPAAYYGGNMSGSFMADFNTSLNHATFNNLTFTSQGRYHINISTYSIPPEYSFYTEIIIDVQHVDIFNMTIEKTSVMQFKFDADYDSVIRTEAMKEYFLSRFSNYFRFLYPMIIINNLQLLPGSVFVLCNVSGTQDTVEEFVKGVCEGIENQTTSFIFNGVLLSLSPYMKIDGHAYYGVQCGPMSIPLSSAVIAIIVIASVLAFGSCISLVYWRCLVYPRVKIGVVPSFSFEDSHKRDDAFNMILFRRPTKSSLASRSTPVPPEDMHLRSDSPILLEKLG